MEDKKAKSKSSSRKLVHDFLFVSSQMLRMLHKICPVWVYALIGLVLVQAALPYMRWQFLGNLVDDLAQQNPYLKSLILFAVFLLAVELAAVLVKYTSNQVNEFFKQSFAQYLPIVRTLYGMGSFQKGNSIYKDLEQAEKAEYSSRYLVVGQFMLFGRIATVIAGIIIILSHMPIVSIPVGAATLIILAVQIQYTVKMALHERSTWADQAESTNIRNQYTYPLRFKEILLFGMERTLVERVISLQNKIGPSIRAKRTQLLKWDIIGNLSLALAFGAGALMLTRSVSSGAISVGEMTFLTTTIVSVGVGTKGILENMSQQALGMDKLVKLFRFIRDNEDYIQIGDTPSTVISEQVSPVFDLGLKPFDESSQKIVSVFLKESQGILSGLEIFPCHRFSAAGKVVLAPMPLRIEIPHLAFGYEEDRPIFDGANLVIEPGSVTKILGANGAGKTTLLNLLSKLYDVKHGMIFIDGIDIRKIDGRSLRRNIIRHRGQEIFFPRLCTRDLLAMAVGVSNDKDMRSDALEETMLRALEIVHLKDKILSFKRGLDQPFGAWRDDNVDLSGGEQRKLNLAMTIMGLLQGEISVLILDEAFANIQPDHSLSIYRALRNLGVTLILTTHNAQTLSESDRVVFLDNSEPSVQILFLDKAESSSATEILKCVPEDKAAAFSEKASHESTRIIAGTHAELIRTSAAYARLCDTSTR